MTTACKVLVVDDDDGMRLAIETLLNSAGYSTAAYASAEALLAGGEVAAALCVVSDLKLPAMSGLQLLQEARRRGSPLPFILVTAHDTAGLREEALRTGFAAYFTKPFDGQALLGAIRGFQRDVAIAG